MRRHLWAGLDVGVETTSLCVMNDAGEVLQQATCPTNVTILHRHLRWLRRRRFATIGIEAGALTIARGLRSLGYSVDLYETRQLSKFLRVRRNKTDAGDAIGIAEAGRIGATLVSKVYLKSLDSQVLQSRLTLRRFMVRQRVAAVNLLCGQLELYGGRVKRSWGPSEFRAEVEAEITTLFRRRSHPLGDELRKLLHHCEQLTKIERAVDREMKSIAEHYDVCRRFLEIPGVGPLSALTFYAVIGDPYRFRRAKDVGCYLGLTPRLHQSGLSSRSGRISRMGNRAARTLLVQAAASFMRSKGSAGTDLRDWVYSVEQRSGRGRSRVALARKLAVIMVTMWKRNDPFIAKRSLACDSPSPVGLGIGSRNSQDAIQRGPYSGTVPKTVTHETAIGGS